MRYHWPPALLLVVLLTACGAPGLAGPTPTPLLPSEAATTTTAALSQAPQATGGPGGSDIVPTPAVPTLGAADLDASATAQAAATPTPFSAADLATSTAIATGSAGPPLTRTPVVGAATVLPAPLYLRSPSTGQVLRVERDAANYRQLTFERQPVLELAAPAAGGLYYITGEATGQRALVALDSAGRRELLYGKLSDLAVTPDGARAFVRVEDPQPGMIVDQDESPSGIWSTYAEGGRPGLLIADVPADGVFDPEAPAWRYAPIAVSPDGRSLAAYAYDQDGPGIPGGELVLFDLAGQREPVRAPTCCEEPVWSDDGMFLLVAGGGPAPDTRYGLYRVDAATGAETPILSADGGDMVPLVTAPFAAPGGQIYAFVALAPAQKMSWQYPFQPSLARIGPDGAVTPLAPPVPSPIETLWAPGGAGALVSALAEDPERPSPLLWQPADGAPALTLAFDGEDMGWASAGAPLAGGNCGLFTTMSYQEGAARQEDPGVADVQARLLVLGFDGGPPDGLYGEQTRAGVAAFQRARGLPPTGAVDCATWQALLAQP